MTTEKDIKEKWGELLDYAKQHATGEGFHRGYRWLQDSFNEYLKMSDEVPGYGMGGQPGSEHNRQVLPEGSCWSLATILEDSMSSTKSKRILLKLLLPTSLNTKENIEEEDFSIWQNMICHRLAVE